MNIAERVFSRVFQAYAKLNDNCKPKVDEWTVLSAFVAHFPDDTIQVLSLGLGNKCIGMDAMRLDGTVVNDSHAEVVARRALLLFLYNELSHRISGLELKGRGILQTSLVNSFMYELATGVRLYMYISEPPCGDASIFHFTEGDRQILNRTGAKIVCNSSNSDIAVTDVGDVIGYPRRKSGRSDLPEGKRTQSMSCTDKIGKWCALGLQGALLSQYIASIFVSTIVISFRGTEDCRENVKQALRRSLAEAAAYSGNTPPKIEISSLTFEGGRRRSSPPCGQIQKLNDGSCKICVPSSSEQTCVALESEQEPISGTRKRKSGLRSSASGLSVNWFNSMAFRSADSVNSDVPEVTLSALGYKQGYTISNKARDSTCFRHQSRLCKARLFHEFLDLQKAQNQRQRHKIEAESPISTYTDVKQRSNVYQNAKQMFFGCPRYSAWRKDPLHITTAPSAHPDPATANKSTSESNPTKEKISKLSTKDVISLASNIMLRYLDEDDEICRVEFLALNPSIESWNYKNDASAASQCKQFIFKWIQRHPDDKERKEIEENLSSPRFVQSVMIDSCGICRHTEVRIFLAKLILGRGKSVDEVEKWVSKTLMKRLKKKKICHDNYGYEYIK
jgi:hypothetical protein